MIRLGMVSHARRGCYSGIYPKTNMASASERSENLEHFAFETVNVVL
ncbi:hypothetical protein BOMU111920_13430 [Bordetella muralis]|jgi:hypothetical protein